MTVARLTKIGNFRVEKLVLSPDACASVARVLGMQCNEKTSPPIQLCNVHMMSRLGNESYLQIADQVPGRDGRYRVRRIFMPTAYITTMHVNFEKRITRLNVLEAELSGRGSSCDTSSMSLHGDSAFVFGESALTQSGREQLLTFIEEVKRTDAAVAEVRVNIPDHRIDRSECNAWLAVQRANAAKLFLARHLENLAPRVRITEIFNGQLHQLTQDCHGLVIKEECVQTKGPHPRVELEIIKSQPVETK